MQAEEAWGALGWGWAWWCTQARARCIQNSLARRPRWGAPTKAQIQSLSMSPQSSHPHGGGGGSCHHCSILQMRRLRCGQVQRLAWGYLLTKRDGGGGWGGSNPDSSCRARALCLRARFMQIGPGIPPPISSASPRDFHISAQLTLNKVLGSSHFKDKEMMAQRGQVVCLRAQRGQKGHEGSWLLRPMPKRWLTQRGPYRADQATGSHCSIATVCCPSEQLLNVPSPVPAQPLASLGPH